MRLPFAVGCHSLFPDRPSARHCQASRRPPAVQTEDIVLETFQAAGLTEIDTGIFGPPTMDGRIRVDASAAQIGDRNTRLAFLMEADDPVFGEPAALPRRSCR